MGVVHTQEVRDRPSSSDPSSCVPFPSHSCLGPVTTGTQGSSLVTLLVSGHLGTPAAPSCPPHNPVHPRHKGLGMSLPSGHPVCLECLLPRKT